VSKVVTREFQKARANAATVVDKTARLDCPYISSPSDFTGRRDYIYELGLLDLALILDPPNVVANPICCQSPEEPFTSHMLSFAATLMSELSRKLRGQLAN